jgi:hypothetical protein
MSQRNPQEPTEHAALGERGLTSGKKGDYEVGYCRPPTHSRFKSGQSGNPNGRPAGRASAKTRIERVINKKVSVRHGHKSRDITMLEAILHAHAAKGAKGDARSAGLLIGLLPRAGLLEEQGDQIKIDHGDGSEMGGASLVVSAKASLVDVLLQDIDVDQLTDDEQVELALLCETIGQGGGITALSLPEFARFKQLINKGEGMPPESAADSDRQSS